MNKTQTKNLGAISERLAAMSAEVVNIKESVELDAMLERDKSQNLEEKFPDRADAIADIADALDDAVDSLKEAAEYIDSAQESINEALNTEA